MLRKAVLTRDCSKKHIKQNWCKRNTSIRKTDCPFDAVAVVEDKGWKSCLQDENHNDEPILAGASTHRKAARNGEALEQIAIHARRGASPPQALTHLRLGHDAGNPIFKSQDIYNERQRI